MNDRRTNWKEAIGNEANERIQKKLALLDRLEEIRADLRACGTNFEKRDAVSLRYRETVAQLATL